MTAAKRTLVLLSLAALVAACGDNGAGKPTTSAPATTAPTTPATTAPPTTAPATTAPASTTPATTAPATTAPATTAPPTTTEPVTLEQPAVWPAPNVVFTTPEAVAEDFVKTVLQVPPVLGEYQAGDSLSGEIEVFFPGESPSATRVSRSLLLVRRLGPSLGWFVLAAVSPYATITSPEARSTVPSAPLTVTGVARGFEGTVHVSAIDIHSGVPVLLDRQIVHGGALETPGPYTTSLDLSKAGAGHTVVILVRGDTGLETDPGDFGALPVVIQG